MARSLITPGRAILIGVLVFGLLFACILVVSMQNDFWIPPDTEVIQSEMSPQEDQSIAVPIPSSTPTLVKPILTPTPDAPHPLPAVRAEEEQYVVQPRDSLHFIAQRYFVSVEDILGANEISQPDYLEIGQVLTIPAPQPDANGPGFKIIPDSELVYSPSNADFDVQEFVHSQGGYLSGYKEKVDDTQMSGVKIVQRVAQEFSINPRLLLAVLEYQSGWVTNDNPDEETIDYPLGLEVEWRNGLYNQLGWAADNLNRGYYLWRVGGIGVWILSEGSIVKIDPSINAGTAGVQHLFSQLYEGEEWQRAVSSDGLFSVYNDFFGYPFHHAVEPLLPADLSQPSLQLPFESGVPWSFTGGPHGGYGSGSAWAAIDFAPPGEALGCVPSEAWVVAIADGLVLRAGDGAVVQDLDNDGLEQTGWTVLYMHVEARERIREGTFLQAGEPIGHPSCEGGFSSGTHLHLARRYNGEWISADQDLPFVMDGWTTEGLGREYDGYLTKAGKTVEAWEGRNSINEIQR
jgi:murein DD-endopeptidase MepM/ murein hydrolase activator NlpD